MASDREAIVDERLIPYYYISQAISFFVTLLLFIFHLYRVRHIAEFKKRTKKKLNRIKSIKLFGILDLASISYCCLIVLLLQYSTFLTPLVINLFSPFLTHVSCQWISYMQTTWALLLRFLFHVFVAARSRFSSFRQKFTIYGKLDLD